MSLRLIAEIGVNHDGDPGLAVEMAQEAAAAGFDAVKLQHWHVDELLAAQAPNAAYQGQGDQHELLERLRLDADGLSRVREAAHRAGVAFVVTPDGVRACHDLVVLGVDALKIGSGDADNPWLLESAVASGLPLIVSTGMMDDSEVIALGTRVRDARDVTVLHCVSAYPTPTERCGLPRMASLAALTGRPVGFSDHTIGVAAAAAAVALGAVAIEKHVTYSTSATGPDHAMSLPLAAAPEWVAALRDIEKALTENRAADAEAANRPLVRKGLYARHDLDAGARLEAGDVVPLRPLLDGIAAGDRDAVVGRTLAARVAAGTLLRPTDLR
ncbi:MAG TPA: N-acetylneuraminate synthase family protein [Candidatus Dormibacteraeota bacterium]|nr:N-acetylneuraminate synthase family protein [Candidatus Dormibacteraeota bacterium]